MRARRLALDLPLSLLWAMTLVAYVFLPEAIPAHWGPGGLDRLRPKYELFFLPLVLTLLVVGGYALLQRGGQRDPAFLALFGFIAWLGVFLQGFTLALGLQSLASGAAPGPLRPRRRGRARPRSASSWRWRAFSPPPLGSPFGPRPRGRTRALASEPGRRSPTPRSGTPRTATRARRFSPPALAALLLPALWAALLLVALLLLAAFLGIGQAKTLARKKAEQNPGP